MIRLYDDRQELCFTIVVGHLSDVDFSMGVIETLYLPPRVSAVTVYGFMTDAGGAVDIFNRNSSL